MAKKQGSGSKKKTVVRVKRYVTVTKTVVKKPKDHSANKTGGSSKVVGTFAGVKFQVKTDKNGKLQVLTPSDIEQTISSNWVEHPIIGRKFPKTEFVGANIRTFTMTIVVDRMLGQNPHSVMHKLNKFCEEGGVSELKIGSHKIGNKWNIQEISEAFNRIYSKGQLTKATLNLTLAYYD